MLSNSFIVMILSAVFRVNMKRKYSSRGLEERFRKYGLELAEEKTKILEFGRFARRNRKTRGKENQIPLTFLVSRFIAGMDGKKEFFRCRVKTSKKKFRSKIKAIKEWIKTHRTMALEQIFKTVNAKLRGHYQYYGGDRQYEGSEKILEADKMAIVQVAQSEKPEKKLYSGYVL